MARIAITVRSGADTPGMANLVVSRPDRYPNGTVLSAYPANARRADGGQPGAAALETQTVAAEVATFTTLANDTPYHFYASALGLGHSQRLSVSDTGKAAGTVTTTNASAALSAVAATSGAFAIGQRITGAGIPPGTYLIAGSGAAWTMSDKATASASGVAVQADGGSPAVVPSDKGVGALAVPVAVSTWRAQVMQRRAIIGTS